MGMGIDSRERIARRAAKEITSGMVVNLGIGIPTLVADFVNVENVMFHAENGVLGIGVRPHKGEEDANLCNAGGYPITLVNGGSYFDSSIAFGMIRRGRIDVTVLGALEVSETGDLANWIVPGKRVPGIGGAMELAEKSKKVVVLMNHVNKEGTPKVVKQCTFPLTAYNCVSLIITDMAVIEVANEGLVLKEVFRPFSVKDVIEKTGARLIISDKVKYID